MLTVCYARLNQLVSVSYFNSIYTTLSRFSVCRKNCFFNNAVPCCHYNIVIVIEILNANKSLYFFTWVTSDQINNCTTSGSSPTLRYIIHLKPITLSLVSKKQHIVMCVCYKKMLNKIFLFAHRPLDASPPAPLGSIGIQSSSLYIALVCYRKNNLLLSNHVFHRKIHIHRNYFSAPFVAILVSYFKHFIFYDFHALTLTL